MPDQFTPYGSSVYEQSGTWADGTPKFKQTVSLSPEEQRNQEQQWQFDNLVNQLGINQTQKLSGHLDQPIKLGNEATESRLMELGSKRVNPIFEQRRQQQLTELLNRGITPGSEAYQREADTLGQQENDAYNQLLLTGRGQANQELLTERNQPINQITALMSGGQVTQPNFSSTPQTNVARSVQDLFETNLAFEREDVDMLRKAIVHASKVGDFSTRHKLEEMVVDSEEHVDYFERQLATIAQVGLPIYLAEQLKS